MLGRQILKSHFGKHYKFHFIKDGPVPRSLEPLRFSSSHSVRQFLQRLQAPHSYWHWVAQNCEGGAAALRGHQRDHLQVIGDSVIRGRLRIYEVDLPDTHTLATSATAIQDRQGYQFQFVPMKQALASPAQTPRRFSHLQQVYDTLYDLAPNIEQLHTLASNLKLTPSPDQKSYSQLIDVLAEALAEQQVVLYVKAPFKRPEPSGAAMESAANIPGNRKVELAPATLSAQARSLTQQNTDAHKRLGGAGGSWKVFDEIADPSVIKQVNNLSCGQACVGMMLEDRQINAPQSAIAKIAGNGPTYEAQLASVMNELDLSGGREWIGAGVDATDLGTFHGLSSTGSWSAQLWEKGNKIGHWVVVDGMDDVGRVIVRDPWHGTKYKMDLVEFQNTWTGFSVWGQ